MPDSYPVQLGEYLPDNYRFVRGDCPECGGQCAPECGTHPLGCIFGGPGTGYWMIADGCELDHGPAANAR